MITIEQKQNNHELLSDLRIENALLRAENKELKSQLKILQEQVAWLTEQLNLKNQLEFGPSTEKANSLPLGNLDDETQGLQEPDSENQSSEDDAELETITYTRRKKTKGRSIDTSKLPREIRTHDLAEHEKVCGCGKALVKFTEDRSEQIDYIPASVKVIEHVCPQYTCRSCETVVSAKKPASAIPKAMATNGFISEVIIEKYQHHIPLYRQSKRFAGHGLIIPDNTLGNWVMKTADLLQPLYTSLWLELLKTKYLQADETTLKVLKPSKKGYMWVYHSAEKNNRFVVFEFALSRGKEVPVSRLASYEGKFQTDGYAGYNPIHNKDEVISFGCWDHARRKIVDTIRVANNNKKGVAGRILDKIGKLYSIEKQIKSLSSDERKEIRQQQAKPILDEIYALALETKARPKSKLGIALTYIKNQWPKLITYLEHGEINISNCWTENIIRPLAIGRKNWLFAGNVISANKGALHLSLINSCLLNDINPRHYYIYVLSQADKLRRGEIEPRLLLPHLIDKSLLQSSEPGQL